MSKNETKRAQRARELVQPGKLYGFQEAVAIAKQLAQGTKFKETVDIAVQLGVDPRKSDQVVRAATTLPHGTGKTVRIAVFAQGPQAQAAQDAGADIVGFEDLADHIKECAKTNKFDFDVLIATPDAMRLLGPLGRVLGPRNLMPNPKVGTVTADVGNAVSKAKSGQVTYRTDKAGIIHTLIGKIDFSEQALLENAQAVLADLRRAKPSTSKGVYIRKVSLSTTMGPGLALDLSGL